MKKVLLILSLLLFIPVLAQAGNKMAVGINYPGLSFKYFLNDKICLEPKVQFGNDIFVGGLRGSYYFTDLIYSGVEADYITFKGDISEGYGAAASIYGGIEIAATQNITVQLDVGPVWILLSDKNYDVSGSYLEILGNIGLNYYFK